MDDSVAGMPRRERDGARMADLSGTPTPSVFHVEKQRAAAVVTLASGPTLRGCFFVAGGSPHHPGPERVGDLLNSEPGFFPFETEEAGGIRTVLCNRSQVVMVALADNEAVRDPGYAVARRRVVSMLLSNGQRVAGAVQRVAGAGSSWGPERCSGATGPRP